MRKWTYVKRALLTVWGLLLLAASVQAFDFDSLFDDAIVVEEEVGGFDHADALLIQEKTEIGGSYRFELSSIWNRLDGEWTELGFVPTLTSRLYLDARPSRDFRVFASGDLEYATEEASFTVKELFSDFNAKDQVFFRGGKQTINWGVGYFFSPADVLNIGRIDPAEPDKQVEGPVALRMHIPRRRANYYLYSLVDEAEELSGIAWAPRASFVARGTEIGVGGYFQSSRVPRGMVTVSSSIYNVSVFGEGMLSVGSDKQFFEEDPSSDNPFGVTVVDGEGLFYHATAGARFSYSDDSGWFRISGAGQYLFNGEGYGDPSILPDLATREYLVQTGAISSGDRRQLGRHYGAISLSWNRLLNTDLSSSAFWIGNLTDGSGLLNATLSASVAERITPSLSVSRFGGDAGSEYAPFGSGYAVRAGVSFGNGAF